MSQTRAIQYLAGGLAAGFLILAGALLAIPLLIREPLPVVRPDIPTMLTEDQASGAFQAQIDISAAGYFDLLMLLPGSGDAPPVRFDMPATTMDPVEPEIEALGSGRFRASDRLATPGRWRLRVGQDGEILDMEFMLAEF